MSWLVFSWLMKVVKTTLSTALTLAAIIMVLQIIFGIDIPMLMEAVQQLPQTLGEIVGNLFGDR